jgi:tRNA A37 N6-isopentenylltransferase MiaA
MGSKDLVDIIKYSVEHVGAAYTVVMIFIGGGMYYIHRLFQKNLKSKDDEILRLTAEKDRLQDHLLSELSKLRKKKP